MRNLTHKEAVSNLNSHKDELLQRFKFVCFAKQSKLKRRFCGLQKIKQNLVVLL